MNLQLGKLLIEFMARRYENPALSYFAIFGAGDNGRQLQRIFENHGVNLDFYVDNDRNKQGQFINGVPCISVEDLVPYKDKVTVFISPTESDGIEENLKYRGIQHTIPSEIIKIIRLFPQSRITDAFENLPPIGHFYSLYPDIDEVMRKEDRVFNQNKEIVDVDLNEEQQVIVLRQMTQFYDSIPRWEPISNTNIVSPLRYRYGNPNLSAGDAIGLHCMLRLLKPNRLIEVGSGYSSAVTLDTNEFFLDNSIKLTFIEPYPQLIKSLLKTEDVIELLVQGLQDTSLVVFEQLESGDVLFIDSTHVTKVDSDVNYLLFEVLPRLKSGVIIHLHDIFYPFEYPKEWILDGRCWNELYILRAFLQNNSNYSIIYFQNMMEKKHSEIFKQKWPLDISFHGGSIWLRKE
ncbi:class I SAM-dependent methyltransferase [Paenibacillus glycinis]|nr:class I SAM-dependent methyltransferase [Paenibacillus glycinis]